MVSTKVVIVEDGPSTPDKEQTSTSCSEDSGSFSQDLLAVASPRGRGGSFVTTTEWVTESNMAFACQVLVPFLICGFGNLGAGQLLDLVQHWAVFRAVPELYVLVPSLMGLKGNLEMTMASRLSTAVRIPIHYAFPFLRHHLGFPSQKEQNP